MPPRKSATKPSRKTPAKKSPSRKTPVKKTPAKKSPAKKTPAKKSPSRKTPAKKSTKSVSKGKTITKDSKTKPRSVSDMFKKSTAASGECNAGYTRDSLSRQCKPIPCFDTRTGEIIRGATRGPNGACRLPRCGDGYILNPMTGKCIGTDTSTGQALLPYKYEADARAARAKADRYSRLSPYANEGYPGMFRAFADGVQRQRIAHGHAQEAASVATRARKTREVRDFERRVAFLKAGLGYP